MQRAERQPVADKRFTVGVRIRHDVSGIQHFFMPETTESALPTVGFKYTFSERALVQADPHCRGDIPPP